MSDFEGEGARGVNLLAQKELQTVLSRSVQDITCRFAGIQLWEQECPLSDDICTVYTTFDGGHHAALLLCADTPLLARLARKILHSESVTPRDIEDVATEYFNIICGQVVAGLFQAARISSRFHSPVFHLGRYLPEEKPVSRCVLNYSSHNNERIQLVHLGLLSPP